MKPTEILRAEHVVILRSLDVLAHLAQADALDTQGAALLVEFLQTYADTYHHLKEEQQLFPAMHANGAPRHFGPVAVMLDDHDAGRTLVGEMVAALEAGHDSAFRVPAMNFVELLRDHIAKENEILFPMADGMIPEDQVTEVLAGYEVVEAECGSRPEELCSKVLAMAERLALPETTQAAGGCMGGTCGAHSDAARQA